VGSPNRSGDGPKRSSRVRVSFIETLKQFDPLDAIVLKKRSEIKITRNDNAITILSESLSVDQDDVLLSVQNVIRLNCGVFQSGISEFDLNTYGRVLLRACAD
jgi:hypothetical protein